MKILIGIGVVLWEIKVKNGWDDGIEVGGEFGVGKMNKKNAWNEINEIKKNEIVKTKMEMVMKWRMNWRIKDMISKNRI